MNFKKQKTKVIKKLVFVANSWNNQTKPIHGFNIWKPKITANNNKKNKK